MLALEHPSEATLLAVLNEKMPPDQVERILEHLDSCKRCERRLEELEPGIADYRRFRQRIAPQLPVPTRPWPDIWVEMERLDLHPAKARSMAGPRQPVPTGIRRMLRPAWIGALAAGILICALILFPRSGGLLRAETLLRKASVAVSQSPSRTRSHLRVKTRSASFNRPAVLGDSAGPDGLDGVRSRFQAAHYDWTDPLNPAAFEQWRNGLHKKADKVAVTDRDGAGDPKEYTIDTATAEGALRKAALTIQAHDLLPVSGRFEFADEEWVEIANVSDAPSTATPLAGSLPAAPVTSPAAMPAPPVVNRPVLSEIQLAEREIEVRAAIDRLHTPIGEPIGIEVESGSVVVTPYGLLPQQEGQLRATLQGMEGVIIRPPERDLDRGPDTPVGSKVATAAPFPAIDTSEAIVARAHLLNQLAIRFPQESEARLSTAARGLLVEMRSRHAAAINRDIDTLASQLSSSRPLSVLKESPSRDTRASPPSAAALTQAAASVHRLVTSVYAAGVSQTEAASAWPELAGEFSRLRYLARQQLH